MSFVVSEDLDRQFTIYNDIDSIFTFLSNLPEIFTYYPGVKKIAQIEKDTFRWDMKQVNAFGYPFELTYASTYFVNRHEYFIKWQPVQQVGNAQMAGHWKLNPLSTHRTHVHFYVHGDIQFPYSKLLKPAAKVVLKNEGSKLTDIYLNRIKEILHPGYIGQKAPMPAIPCPPAK